MVGVTSPIMQRPQRRPCSCHPHHQVSPSLLSNKGEHIRYLATKGGRASQPRAINGNDGLEGRRGERERGGGGGGRVMALKCPGQKQ